MRRGWLAFHTPMLWTIGCIVVLGIGGSSGFIIANARADRVLQDSYFVAAYLHYLLWLAAVFGFFAGWYYLFPKLTGFAYSDLLGRIHFGMSFIGVSIMLAPHIFIVPWMVQPTAYAPDALDHWNLVSWIGSCIFAAGSLVFFINMALSLLRRQPASP